VRIQKLQIEQKFARISIQNQMARLQIRTPIRRIKEVDVKRAQMIVQRKGPRVQIDSGVLLRNTARGGLQHLLSVKAAEARQSLQKVIKNLNQKAKVMLESPDRSQIIAQNAMNDMLSVPEMYPKAEIGENPVAFGIDPGMLQIDWTEHEITIRWDEYQAPVIVVDPKPSVNIMLEQEPSIEIKVVEHVYPPEQGATVNTEV
jgi:hypothetical protein